ncbi:regucalcin isoform X2 [Nilaparvata lugens]|uniref:regucalcin isoform X1 n=1 Tax=Nilaparvata lugens TaxID=108931 RepID=UPI000B986F40|nr:regucalcin isoform X1 [Nilaparvata lugens]XP_039289143.1 regucalcin isoform X2 [Nilaparvata lugens]
MFQMEKCIFLVLLFTSTSVYGDDYTVTSISDTNFQWAHSPYWDATSQSLYFADIDGGTVSCYQPSTKNLNTAKVDPQNSNTSCSVVVPLKGQKDKYVVGVNSSVATLTWDSKSSSTSKPAIITELTQNKTIRTHTGKADPMGRFWIGTLGPFREDSAGQEQPAFLNSANEYLITAEGKAIIKIPDVSIPDGLAWNADKTKMYFVDTYDHKILVFDYDNGSGDISNKKVVFDSKANNIDGYPAGMAIDTEGKLWVALFFGGSVLRVDPDSGKLLQTVNIPAKEPTSCTFGGENLDILYVTSARIFQKVAPPTEYSGRVYAVTGLKSGGKPVTGYPGRPINAI